MTVNTHTIRNRRFSSRIPYGCITWQTQLLVRSCILFSRCDFFPPILSFLLLYTLTFISWLIIIYIIAALHWCKNMNNNWIIIASKMIHILACWPTRKKQLKGKMNVGTKIILLCHETWWRGIYSCAESFSYELNWNIMAYIILLHECNVPVPTLHGIVDAMNASQLSPSQQWTRRNYYVA